MLPKKVRIVEAGPRDGLQNEAGHYICAQLGREPSSKVARALAAKRH